MPCHASAWDRYQTEDIKTCGGVTGIIRCLSFTGAGFYFLGMGVVYSVLCVVF